MIACRFCGTPTTGRYPLCGSYECAARDNAPDDSPDDTAILDAIAALLDSTEWQASTIEDVADLVRASGRTIRDSDEPGPKLTALLTTPTVFDA